MIFLKDDFLSFPVLPLLFTILLYSLLFIYSFNHISRGLVYWLRLRAFSSFTLCFIFIHFFCLFFFNLEVVHAEPVLPNEAS